MAGEEEKEVEEEDLAWKRPNIPGRRGRRAYQVGRRTITRCWRALLSLIVTRYGLVVFTALVAATTTYPFAFFRKQPHETLNELFDSEMLRSDSEWHSSRYNLFVSLFIMVCYKFGFAVITQGCAIPVGVFTPAFTIGAAGGRLFGEILANGYAHESLEGVTAGAYAVVGAAAMAAAVTHTVSPAVIVFELTGQSAYMLPVLVAVILANATAAVIAPSVRQHPFPLAHRSSSRMLPPPSSLPRSTI